MSGSEIDAVRALLHAKARPIGWAERRARLDEVAGHPAASDIALRGESVDGLPLEWSIAPGSNPERVLLYFHGGGYCSGSIRSHRGLVTEAGRASGAQTLAVGYRLAPEHPFPAALEDAKAAYALLRARGVSPQRIAIGGDSAGGGLTLALMTSLRDVGASMPACGWLISPWVDLAMTGATMASKAAVDPLIQKPYLKELADAYRGGAGFGDPRLSPLLADLTGLPPLLVQVGTAETLLDDAVRIAARAGAADVAATLEIWPHMIHAWMLWAKELEAGRAALASAGAFMRARLA